MTNSTETSWFLANVVERGEDPGRLHDNPKRRCFTWVNTLLIKASSPSEAYDKAMRIAKKRYPLQYVAIAGNTIRWTVLGLSDLNPIDEDLKDGSEISWNDMGYISAKRSSSMVRSKRQLTA